MQHSDLFSAALPKAGKARRNSPRTPSTMALSVVRNLSSLRRMEAAKDIIAVFADVGVDRKKLADYLGLSHSSTSHWHHGANSISAHNLAVLVDALHEYLRPTMRAILALNSCGRVASIMSAMGLMWAHNAESVAGPDCVASADHKPSSQDQPHSEPVAAMVRGEIIWTHRADGSFAAPGLRIVPDVDELGAEPRYKVTIGFSGFAGRRLYTESLADAFAVCQHFAEACS